jgi:hypothetical protein
MAAWQPQTLWPGSSGKPYLADLRLLRSRSGINPLATGFALAQRFVCIRQVESGVAPSLSRLRPDHHLRGSRLTQGSHNPCGEGIYPRWAAWQPQNLLARFISETVSGGFATAAQPIGDKSPRHRFCIGTAFCVHSAGTVLRCAVPRQVAARSSSSWLLANPRFPQPLW